MSFECACGKKFKHQSTLSQHGNGKGNFKKPCNIYQDKKGRGEKVNVASNFNNNNTINGNNNIIGDNSGNTSITQNIQINAFGKEDISMLTDEILKGLTKAPKSCIQNTYTHIVSDKSNRNVRDTDPSRKLLRVYDGEEWRRMNRNTILNKIIQDVIKIIRDHLDAHGGINRFQQDQLHDRIYKTMSTELLRMERNKIGGIIVQNT